MNHPANSSMGRQDQPAVYIDEHGIIKSQNAAFRELIELKRGADSLPRDLVALLVKHWAEESPFGPFKGKGESQAYSVNIIRFEDSSSVIVLSPTASISAMASEKIELEERIEQLETFLETSYDGFWICDHEGRVIQINKAAIHLNGLEGQDIIGRKVEDLVAEGYYDRSVTLEVLEKKESTTVIVNSSNGKKLLATGKPMFDENGQIKNVIVNVRDVTLLNELHERLKKTEAISRHYRSEALKVRASLQVQKKMVYCSGQMDDLMVRVSRVAETETTVLIRGESGVGKSLLAECLHALSERGDGPFFTINCGILPPSLIESELFGYKGGAFTGASSKGKPGLVEMSEGGTLFLDEIAELPLSLQAKLLDFMENKAFTRIGGVTRKMVDTRIICATNRDLDEMVRNKQFRDDLFFRLGTVPVHIPPLRSRPEDISLLTKTFLRQMNEKHQKAVSLSSDAMNRILSLHFSGNVRELKHLVERLVVMGDSQELTPQQVEELLYSGKEDPQAFLRIPVDLTLVDAKNVLEKQMIQKALAKDRNQESVAASLGLTQSTVSRKIQKHNLG